jgi:hypothetical protein
MVNVLTVCEQDQDVRKVDNYHHPVSLSRNLGTLTSWNTLGPFGPVTGLLYLYLLPKERDLIFSAVTGGSLAQHTVKLGFSSVIRFPFLKDVGTFFEAACAVMDDIMYSLNRHVGDYDLV